MPLILRLDTFLRRLPECKKGPYQHNQPSIAPQIATSMRRHCVSPMRGQPLLSAEGPDEIVNNIAEDELYAYRRNRWICNETLQLSERYLKFDLNKLLDAAVAASEGAQYCTRVHKCREGLNNKAFQNPCAGPAFYNTASEVATREFLRDLLEIPSPRILAWCADRNNPVKAEYILEERAPGVPLGSLWYQWEIHSRLGIIQEIVEMERKLASAKFLKSGCIFFREDAPPDNSSDISLSGSVLPLPLSSLDRFKLGPLVSSELWRGDRSALDLNRGPYNEPQEFIKAMGTNEIQFIKTHAHPRMNYHRSLIKPELPNEVLTLLERYLQLAPAMIPPKGPEDIHSPTLWHPDLHLDNIFVDPESQKITRIIDWQSATVMPLFYQCGIARMFQCPWTPFKIEVCLKYYEALTHTNNPRHWAALQLQRQNLEARTEPSRAVIRVWENRNVLFLRRALLEMIEQWDSLCPGALCPVSFSEQELKLHEIEEDSMSDSVYLMRHFRDNWAIPPDGMVEPSRFDEIRAAVEEVKEKFIAAAGEDAEKAARIWPYQDRDPEG
ncbi:hypothetical protein N431DRAFT_541752 [Stipitochalara longipes BDJ]|nr:hypothetical protein N431DRAFT_541752 [Stipitochalara longipes BDJ]